MPRILSRTDLSSSRHKMSKFGKVLGGGGGGERSHLGSAHPSSNAAVSESCGVSTSPSMKDTSSSMTTSCTDLSSNFCSYVQSLEEYTSSLDQEVQPSSVVNEWGHFVDFQEEPDESWVGAFLNRHAQKRKSQE
jgi:hypothetical protein